MNPIRTVRRLARILAAGAWALLALAIASPAMAATASVPHYGPGVAPAHVPAGAHTALRLPPGVLSRLEGPVQLARQPAAAVPARIHAVTGGMPGWQITLIAIGAALAAATLAVLADRAVSSRRRVIPTAA